MDITSDFANECIRQADKMIYKFEYHEGYYAAGNNISYDENKSDAWKEGYADGIASLYGDEE